MLDSEIQPTPSPADPASANAASALSNAAPALSKCPQCSATPAILRIITGRSGSEYWTMRCPGCGAIHLDIVNPSTAPHAS
jgi:Zn finger protein HypA/HybF involved in hydrogenase expression